MYFYMGKSWSYRKKNIPLQPEIKNDSVSIEMKKRLAALFLIIACLSGCSDRKAGRTMTEDVDDSEVVADTVGVEGEDPDELIADEPMSVAVDELFDDFIFNFAANRKLQMERIVFPLLVNSGEKKEYIERQAWKMERFFMHQDYYTLIVDTPEQIELLKDTALTAATVEKIFLDDHFVRQYLFHREKGRWMLTEIRNQTMPRNPNAPFLNFYEQFVSDSVFQRESLCNEIEFVGPDPDDDFKQMEGVITPDFWDAFRPDLPKGLIYNIVCGNQHPSADQKIFVLRGIANGLEVELTFRLRNGRWKLRKMTT